jgi:hypothetical protein
MSSRSIGEKIEEGLAVSDFAIRIAADVRGDLRSVTTPSEEELLAQASLPRLWRDRKGRTTR